MAIKSLVQSTIKNNVYYRAMLTRNNPYIPVLDKIQYLVIAGGGGTTHGLGGGGGAGGYRSSVVGETSGRGATAETPYDVATGSNYFVKVGAGGPGNQGSNQNLGGQGIDSQFHNTTSLGGGRGTGQSINYPSVPPGQTGGSGSGGVRNANAGGSGTTGQGYDGGNGSNSGNAFGSGGGGGAGGNGDIGTSLRGGDGGAGVTSSITGSAVTRAGGGGGCGNLVTARALGQDGGGDGAIEAAGNGFSLTSGTPGAANTGGGGGGGGASGLGQNGGSGVVIIKYPNTYTISVGAGLASSTDSSSVPGYKITTFTQGEDNISFS